VPDTWNSTQRVKHIAAMVEAHRRFVLANGLPITGGGRADERSNETKRGRGPVHRELSAGRVADNFKT
jgi:hypothetical protein